jgi:hypothetical protein
MGKDGTRKWSSIGEGTQLASPRMCRKMLSGTRSIVRMEARMQILLQSDQCCSVNRRKPYVDL